MSETGRTQFTVRLNHSHTLYLIYKVDNIRFKVNEAVSYFSSLIGAASTETYGIRSIGLYYKSNLLHNCAKDIHQTISCFGAYLPLLSLFVRKWSHKNWIYSFLYRIKAPQSVLRRLYYFLGMPVFSWSDGTFSRGGRIRNDLTIFLLAPTIWQ